MHIMNDWTDDSNTHIYTYLKQVRHWKQGGVIDKSDFVVFIGKI